MKANVQISLHERISSAWHTLVGHHGHIWQRSTRIGVTGLALDDLTRPCLDDQGTTIQLSDFPLLKSKGRGNYKLEKKKQYLQIGWDNRINEGHYTNRRLTEKPVNA